MSSTMMSFSNRLVQGFFVFDISGEICIYNVRRLKEAVGLCQDKGVVNIIFNLEKVDYVDSTGIQFLLATTQQMKEAKGKLVVAHANADVLETFKLTRTEKILQLAPNVEAGVEMFPKAN